MGSRVSKLGNMNTARFNGSRHRYPDCVELLLVRQTIAFGAHLDFRALPVPDDLGLVGY